MGCSISNDTGGFIKTEPQFIGFITQIQPGSDRDVLGWISVESHADKLVHRHIITITNETQIFVYEGGTYTQVNFEAFREYRYVKVWFAGNLKKPYPRETTARQVVIIDRPR